MRRGNCAAVLAPELHSGLKLLAPASYIVDGNLSVRLKRGSGEVFAWKKTELPVTSERMQELNAFRQELTEILDSPAIQ